MRHDLEARHNSVAMTGCGREDGAELAVDAIPDSQLAFVRLDVNVTGPLPDGSEQQAVDERDRRRVAAVVE
jgi:hypothetical protein